MSHITLGDRRKTVTFNLDKERELYELACSLNFSAFVKRQLLEEWKRRSAVGKSSLTIKMSEEG